MWRTLWNEAARNLSAGPLQWSDEPNGGFSTAPEEKLLRPQVPGRKWGPVAINVAAQEHEPDAMLTWMERLIRRRREMPEIAFGEWNFIPFPNAEIFALRYDWDSRSVLLLHNLGNRPSKSQCRPDGAEVWGRLATVLGRGQSELAKDGTLSIDLPAHGTLWLRIRTRVDGGL